jgi:hypothetical protein
MAEPLDVEQSAAAEVMNDCPCGTKLIGQKVWPAPTRRMNARALTEQASGRQKRLVGRGTGEKTRKNEEDWLHAPVSSLSFF